MRKAFRQKNYKMSYIENLRIKIGHDPILMPCVSIILGDGKGKILLQKRKDNKKWALHGGALELDEEIESGLKRELYEETGFLLDEYAFFGIYSGKEMHYQYPNKDEVSVVSILFYSHRFHGEKHLQKEEVEELCWFEEKEVQKLAIHDLDKKAIQDYFEFLRKEKKI